MEDVKCFFLLALISLLFLPGCALVRGVAQTPTQSVLVSTEARPMASGVIVNTFAFPPGGGVIDGHIEGEGGVLLTERARPFTAAGISANRDLFVAGYWGGQPGFNSLHLYASENGRIWSRAGNFLLAASSQIDDDSRPSLTYWPASNTWFVAFRDASNELIQISEFDIRCLSAGGGRCQQDNRGVTAYTSTLVSQTNTGLAASRPPTLSYVDGNLVLAFVAPLGATVSVSTSPDGAAFSAPVAATSGGSPIICNAGAPYLNNNLGTLFLATAMERSGGISDIQLWRSLAANGTAWTPVRTISSVGNTSLGRISPAIAGPESEMIVAHRTHGQDSTTVLIGGGTLTLSTDTSRSVSLAHGPGPTHTAQMACAHPSLVARGSAGDVAVPLGGSVSVPANGDITLLCGPSFQGNAGCPANTGLITIRRGTGGSFILECWRR